MCWGNLKVAFRITVISETTYSIVVLHFLKTKSLGANREGGELFLEVSAQRSMQCCEYVSQNKFMVFCDIKS